MTTFWWKLDGTKTQEIQVFQSKSTWQFCDCDFFGMVISVTFSEVVTVSYNKGIQRSLLESHGRENLGPINGCVVFFQIGIAWTYDEIHPDLRGSVLIATRCVFSPSVGELACQVPRKCVFFFWIWWCSLNQFDKEFPAEIVVHPQFFFEPGKCPVEYILNKVYTSTLWVVSKPQEVASWHPNSHPFGTKVPSKRRIIKGFQVYNGVYIDIPRA